MEQDNICAIVLGGRSVVFDLCDKDDYIQREISKNKTFYEIDVLEEIGRLPLKEGVACDVGANIGNHALYFSVMLGRKVFAFEPERAAYDQLVRNVRLNHCEGSIETFNVALGAADACGTMVVTPSNLGASKFVLSAFGETQLVTLDATIPSTTDVAIIKIDVEGLECDVLAGASNTIKRCTPLLVVEAQNHAAYLNISRYLESFNYFPVGIKGKTPTFFFMHRSRWAAIAKWGPFLIRKDMDYASRRLHGQLDRIAKSISELPRHDEIRKAAEGGSIPIEQLASQVSELSNTTSQKIEHTSNLLSAELVSRIDAVADGFAGPIGELKAEIQKVAEAASAPIEQLVSQVRELSTTTLQETNKELAQMRKVTADLEGEVSRLLISLQTERARVQFLSRRLHTLYTSGPRPFLGRLIHVVSALTLRKLKPYETWPHFEKRLERRVKSEVDDFKKMHVRVSAQALRSAEHQSTRTVIDNHLSYAKQAVTSSVRKVLHESQLQRERVRIGIASIRIRQAALSLVVDSLYDQADEIVVYLNDYEVVPEFLMREKISVVHNRGDVGDRGKFFNIENFNGYVFTCDDDIHYPPYYVEHCIDAIERYGRGAVVGWHGSVFKKPFQDYYSPDSRRVFSFRSGRPEDIAVHVLGTGCTAFHSSTIKVKFSDFKTSNMADVYFALLGQQQRVPFVVIKHDFGEALPIDIPDDIAINQESAKKTGSQADTRAMQNQLVKEWDNWQLKLPPATYQRNVNTIAYVGRIEMERWKKGGILKSSHLILQALRALGYRVLPVEISLPHDKLISSIKDADIVWIYPGDPERPDFAPVTALIESAAKAGKRVYVNLSYNLKPARSEWIARQLSAWEKLYGTKVKACMFTYAALEDPALSGVRQNLACIPKSISFDANIRAVFEQTEGIFLGDLQKLLNRELVAGEIEDWIAALREALPDIKLYAVRQYGGPIDRELNVTVLPYTKGREWEEWLAKRRVVCCLTPHATYEMIAMEAAGLGVPVLYRPMPQSHSEGLSIAGIRVGTPSEFARACTMLYRDPTIWRMYSDGGRLRAQSQHIEFVSAAIHTHLTLNET